MFLNNFTVKQLLVAWALSRNMSRTSICELANCVPSYITLMLRQEHFNQLIKNFKFLPPDKDTKENKGIGTAFMDIGRMFYSYGENL